MQHNDLMVSVVVFHSAYGLRQAEVGMATRLRAAGHEVITPDLYDGQTAETLDAALALIDTVGWEVICARARRALEVVPDTAVLAGFSMGAGGPADDPFASRPALARWQADADRASLAAEVFTYPGARHFYTDPCLADYHPASAGQTWQRVTTFLASV